MRRGAEVLILEKDGLLLGYTKKLEEYRKVIVLYMNNSRAFDKMKSNLSQHGQMKAS